MNVDIDISDLNYHTKRLYIRNWRQSDLHDLFNYASNLKVAMMAGFEVHKDLKHSQIILNQYLNNHISLAIEYQGHVIGSITVNRYPENILAEFAYFRGRDLGFVLAEEYWGQALMQEALTPLIHYLFEHFDLDFISCGHFLTNRQSRRLQEKLGFRPYRLCRHIGPYDDNQESCLMILYRQRANKGGI